MSISPTNRNLAILAAIQHIEATTDNQYLPIISPELPASRKTYQLPVQLVIDELFALLTEEPNL